MGYGNVTDASSGGGGSQLHTTTIKSYDPLTLCCLLCTGDREGHHILDNFDNQGINILVLLFFRSILTIVDWWTGGWAARGQTDLLKQKCCSDHFLL